MTEKLTIPLPVRAGRKCASQHFGAWAIEPKWFKAAIDAVRAGTWKPEPAADYGDDDEGDDEPGYKVVNGVAIICIDGQMSKRGSSFGGCSTVETRKAVRAAADDWMVRSIILHICSPGGTVSGTSDLADDVLAARGKKPVFAYIADMGCSAAYWVASQCERIYANTTAVVGSIGTYTVLEDDTGFSEQMGIKYRVVSTGEYKGLGADGAVTDKLVADVQREVDELNAPFLAAVTNGRAGKIADVPAIADGRAHVGEQARQLGLIDEIASLDAAIEAISQLRKVKTMTPTEQVKQIAAEHPDAVASFREEGKKAGKAEAHQEEIARLKAIEAACPGRPALAVKMFCAGHDAEHAAAVVAELDAEATKAKASDDARKAELAAKDAEIAKLREQATINAGTVKPVGTTADAKAPAQIDEDLPIDMKAGMEFDNDPKIQAEFIAVAGNKDAARRSYVKFRVNQAAGRTPTPVQK
jgi:signal peptide peptidase SppA